MASYRRLRALTVAAGVATLVVVVGALAFFLDISQDDAREELIVRLEERVGHAADFTGVAFAQSMQSRLPVARQVLGGDEPTVAELERYVAKVERRGGTGVLVDSSGDLLAATPRGGDATELARDPEVQAATDGTPRTSGVVETPDGPGVLFAVPFDSVDGLRVVAEVVPLRVISPFVEDYVDVAEGGVEGALTFVLDSRGRAVAAPGGAVGPPDALLAALAQAPSGEYEDADAMRYASVAVPDSPLRVVTAVSEDELFGSLRREAEWVFVILVALALVLALWALVRAGETAQRVRLEQQLAASQRLESLGQLAAGIAHDFNNVLGVIQGYAGILRDEVRGREDGVTEAVEEIENAAGRGASLSRQLLLFGGRSVADPRELDLNSVVRDLGKVIRVSVASGVETVIELEPDLPPVCADPGQIEQVVLNLVINAAHAMPDGGRLVVSTGRMVDGVREEVPGLGAGEHVMLSVEDTGVGMPPEVVESAFEPFFSTRPQGEGTGLGLSVVYGIVREAEGRVVIRSRVGEGTRVDVYLPVYRQA